MTRQLAKIDDQTFWIQIGETNYTVRLHEFRSIVYVDVKNGNETIISGVRALPNTWILPGILGANGNFRFETYREDRFTYPEYDRFNDKFSLCYYTADEIASMEEQSA